MQFDYSEKINLKGPAAAVVLDTIRGVGGGLFVANLLQEAAPYRKRRLGDATKAVAGLGNQIQNIANVGNFDAEIDFASFAGLIGDIFQALDSGRLGFKNTQQATEFLKIMAQSVVLLFAERKPGVRRVEELALILRIAEIPTETPTTH